MEGFVAPLGTSGVPCKVCTRMSRYCKIHQRSLGVDAEGNPIGGGKKEVKYPCPHCHIPYSTRHEWVVHMVSEHRNLPTGYTANGTITGLGRMKRAGGWNAHTGNGLQCTPDCTLQKHVPAAPVGGAAVTEAPMSHKERLLRMAGLADRKTDGSAHSHPTTPKKEDGVTSFTDRLQTLLRDRPKSTNIVDPPSDPRKRCESVESAQAGSTAVSQLHPSNEPLGRAATTDGVGANYSAVTSPIATRSMCFCGQPTDTQCSGCDVTYYCSEACQQQDWPRHQHECGLSRQTQQSPMTTERPMSQDSIPSDHEVQLPQHSPERATPGKAPMRSLAYGNSAQGAAAEAHMDRPMVVQLLGNLSDVSDDEDDRDLQESERHIQIPAGWHERRASAPVTSRVAAASPLSPGAGSVHPDHYRGRAGYDQDYNARGGDGYRGRDSDRRAQQHQDWSPRSYTRR